MIWLWIYLGGALAWLVVMFALTEIAAFESEKVKEAIQQVSFLLTIIWPVGAAMVLGSMVGDALKPKKAAK